MKIGIIGAGKVGVSISKYLKINNFDISGFYSRRIESAKAAAQFVGSKYFENQDELVDTSDIIFVAVQDDNIKSVWESICPRAGGKIVSHFSGVYSSEIFEQHEKYNAKCCSIHPMFAFSDKYNSYKELDKVNFVMEGDEKALDIMKDILNKTGNKVHIINTAAKAKYHAAAALASNHMIALFRQSSYLLMECGFDKMSAEEILKPLVAGNIESLLKKGCEDALTGPIIRNDVNTVSLHLDALKLNSQNSESDISNEVYTKSKAIYDSYIATAITLLDIAKNSNPEIDYTELCKILTNINS